MDDTSDPQADTTAVPPHNGLPGLSPAQIRAAFARYAAAHTAGDVEAIVALFAPDARVRDPANSPERRGHAALRTFFSEGIAASGGPIEMRLEGAVRVAGNQGAAALIVRTVSAQPVYRVETLDVMTFDEAGRITEMVAFWGPDSFTLEGRGSAPSLMSKERPHG